MNDILRIARLQRAFLGRAILRVIYGPVLTLQVSILANFLHDYLTQSILAGGGVKQGGKPTNHPSELLKWEETAAICNIVEKIYLNMKAN